MNNPSVRWFVLITCLAVGIALANSRSAFGTEPTSRKHEKTIYTPRPPYPIAARGLPFSVRVQVTWSAAGSVKAVKVIQSCGETDLDNYVIGYIRKHWYSQVGEEITHAVTLDFVLRRHETKF